MNETHSDISENLDARIFIWQIDSKDRIVYVNNQWLEYALENDAPELTSDFVLHKPLADFIHDVETLYITNMLLDKVRSKRSKVTIPFNCDSPDFNCRMEMTISPVDDNKLEFRSRFLEKHPREHLALLDRRIERSEDFLTICSWCQMVYLMKHGWVDAEEAVERLNLFGSKTMPKLTHGICQTCLYTLYNVKL